MSQELHAQQYTCSYYTLLRKRTSRRGKKAAELLFPPTTCTCCARVSDIDHDLCRFKGKYYKPLTASPLLIVDVIPGYRLLGKDLQGDTIAVLPTQPVDKAVFDALAYPTVFNERPTKDDINGLRVSNLVF